MASVDFGAVINVSWTSTASGTSTLRVVAPDGTTSTPATTDGANNAHTATLSCSQAGRWLLQWATASEAYVDIVDVFPADPRFLISLADARASLSQTAGNTVNDSDLRVYIAASTPVIEDICGPVLTATRSTTTDASRTAVLLDTIDVIVSTVSVDGTTLDSSLYVVNEAAGVVYAVGSDFGGDLVTVTYTVGSGVVPPNIRLAAREHVRYLWQVGRQGANPGRMGQQDGATTATPSGYLTFKRVVALCTPNARLGGFG